jgi:23S rRNA (cytosine1962-C5)-methyltransferase
MDDATDRAVLDALTDDGLAVAVLAKGGARRFRGGHPWVYRDDVVRLPRRPGFYPVESRKGRRLGWAAVNARSLISVRRVSRSDAPFGEAQLLARLDAALDYRDGLRIDGDGYRLVHAEADGLPALIVDRYADVLVLRNGCAAMEPHLPAVVARLRERLAPRGIVLRLDDPLREREGLERRIDTVGDVPEVVHYREGALRLRVRPHAGQKTGAFLDQRENHARLAALAHGRALDVFAYQGGFGLAMAHHADHVELIDSSRSALDEARAAAEANDLDNLTYVRADAFERLRELDAAGARYDAIALDPPALAGRARDAVRAETAYKELNLRALRLLAPGGVLGTASCSFHLAPAAFDRMLEEAAADAGREVRVLGRHGQPPDHPERLGFPESRYLKFALLQALGDGPEVRRGPDRAAAGRG